jgi:nitroreductase
MDLVECGAVRRDAVSQKNQVVDAIRTRRSVRSYQVGPISIEQLETIVDCGRLAPTALNEQRWEFVVVTKTATLRRVAELAPDNCPFMTEAGACIVICGDRAYRSLYLDGAAAAENMLLAAHALDLGGCWIQALDKPYNAPIMELLGIPDDKLLVALLAIGVPFGEPPALPKRALEDVLHWERY